MERLQEGHLNSPLYVDAFKNVFTIGYDKVCIRHRRIINALASSMNMESKHFYLTCQYILPDIDFWGIIESLIKQSFPLQDIKEMDYYIEIIPTLIQLMTHCWFKTGAINSKPLKHFILFNISRLSTVLHQYHQIGLIKQTIRTTTSSSDKVLKINDLIYYGSSMSVVIVGDNKYIVESNLVLGCLDKLQEESLIKLCALFDDYYEQPTLINRYDDITQLITELKTLRQRLCNNMCHVLKLFEAIIIGFMISMDTMYPSTELWDSTMDDLKKWWPEFQTSYTFRRLNLLTTSQGDILYLLSTSSISKLFGHPMINTQKGYENLHESCSRFKFETIEPSIDVACTLKMILIKSHFIKKHEWPFKERNSHLVIFQPFLNENRWPTIKELKEIPLRLWLIYNLRNLYDLNLDIPLHDMISDKALAPNRSDWSSSFDPCCFTASGLKKPFGRHGSKRVIEEYLSIEDPNYIRTVVTEFDETGLLPQEDLIFVLNPKELEEKDVGRMFCKQTHRVRTIQTVSEKNIKDGILPNMESQTMNLSGIDVDHKLGDIASLYFESIDPSKDFHIVHFNVDFSKWNTNFVLENTFACFTVFDELFNTRHLFQSTHIIFQNSLVVCSNPTNTYLTLNTSGEPMGTNGGYTGHRAGFEGMRQKGWTVITQAAIEMHALVNNYIMFLIGQGDNQVISLRIPGRHPDLNYVDTYFKSLIDVFTSLGLPVKPDETYASSELFSYGRQHYFKGTEVPSSFKKIRRAFPDGNKSHLSIDGDLCSSMTATESCAKSSHQPFTAMSISIIIHIELYTRFLDLGTVSWEDMTIILLHHHIIGGCSQLSTIGYFIRGHEDSLTSVLNLILHSRNCYSCDMRDFGGSKYLKSRTQENIDYQVLLESPGSINVYKQTSPVTWLKELGNKYISDRSRNPEINSWLDLSTEDDKVNLIATLSSANPLYINLSSEVWRCSLPGIKDSMAAKLTNTRTISQAVLTGNASVVNRILDNHLTDIKRKINYMIYGSSGDIDLIELLDKYKCSYQAAQHLRETTWKRDIRGVTVPVPNEMWIADDNSESGKYSILQYGYVNVRYDTVDGDEFRKRGKFKPYYGGTTKEKIFQNAAMELDIKNMIAEIRRNMSLLVWTTTPHLQEYRPLIMKTVSQLMQIRGGDMDSLMKIYRLEGGTLDHRLHSAYYSKTISGNNMLNISSHTSVSTNTLKDTIKSVDWTIVYQSLILWVTSIGVILQHTIPQWFRIVSVDCIGCLNLISSQHVHVPSLPSQISRIPRNNLTIYPMRVSMSNRRAFSICIGALLGQAERHHQSEFNVKNSLQFSMSVKNKRVINLNDLRKVDMNVLLDSLIVHSSLPFIIDYLNFNKTPPSLAIFTITAEHIISSGMVKNLVRCTGIPMMKHGLCHDINKLSSYITFVLINRFHKIKLNYVTDLMPKKLVYKIIDRIQSDMPLLPLDVYIKVDRQYDDLMKKRYRLLRDARRNKSSSDSNSALPPSIITHSLSKNSKVTGVGLVTIKLSHSEIPSSSIIQYLTDTLTVSTGPRIGIPEHITSPKERNKLQVPDYSIHPIDFLRENINLTSTLPSSLEIIYNVREMIPILRSTLIISSSKLKYTLAPPWVTTKEIMCQSVTIESLHNNYIPHSVKMHNKIHHKSRLLIKSTSAASKYFEILNSFNPPSFGCIVNLAEGAGSVASLINHMYPNRGYIFNTLMTETNINTQDLMTAHCPESLLIDKCEFKSIATELDYTSSGDLTTQETWDYILKSLDDNPIGIITMDAESIELDDRVDILHYLAEYIYKMNIVSGSILIIKLLISGITEHLNRSITLPFIDYKVMKPISSNPGNEEFFLVGSLNISMHVNIEYSMLYNLGNQVISSSRFYVNYNQYIVRSLQAQSKFIKLTPCFDPLPYFLQELKINVIPSCICDAIFLSYEHHLNLGSNLKFKELLQYDISLQRTNENYALALILDKINDIIGIHSLIQQISDIQIYKLPTCSTKKFRLRNYFKQDNVVYKRDDVETVVKLSDDGLKLFWKLVGYRYISCMHTQ